MFIKATRKGERERVIFEIRLNPRQGERNLHPKVYRATYVSYPMQYRDIVRKMEEEIISAATGRRKKNSACMRTKTPDHRMTLTTRTRHGVNEMNANSCRNCWSQEHAARVN